MSELLDVVVSACDEIALDIKRIVLSRSDGGLLPAFTAGGHIDLHLPNGLVRSYSLCGAEGQSDSYVLAVARDKNSRGGSHYIHDRLRLGDRLKISAPRNHFALDEAAPLTVLLAGGIGITPMWAMIQRLEQIAGDWQLHYSTRLSQMCAFRTELAALDAIHPGRVFLNFDHEPGGQMTDISAILAGLPAGAHAYCCGPVPMLDAFVAEAAQAGLGPERVHVEYFSSTKVAATAGGFEIISGQSGESFFIPSGSSILDVLLDQGLDVNYSCMEGTCGSCEMRVIEGVPDHRDMILTPEEQAANKTMMICCSGSKSAKLVLDF